MTSSGSQTAAGGKGIQRASEIQRPDAIKTNETDPAAMRDIRLWKLLRRVWLRLFVAVGTCRKRGIPAIFSVQVNVSHTHNAEKPMKTAHDFETFFGLELGA
jgi:hypothetical protein